MFERVTGEQAAMWGPSMVGFGSQPYTNTLGTNDWFIVGFSPRKASLTIYGIHNGYEAPDPLLDELGPHTTGKSCVYVKRLDRIDQTVLETLVLAVLAAGPLRSRDRSRPDERLDLGRHIGRGRHRGDLVGDPDGGLTV